MVWKIKLKMTTVRVVWAVRAHHYHTVVLGALQDERRAGDSVADAGERQHLELVQHELPESGQQRRLRVVPSHDVTAGLGVQVFGPEQNLERWYKSTCGHGDAGCQEGTLNLKAQTSPTTAVFKAMDLVSLRWYLEGKMSSRAHKELE